MKKRGVERRQLVRGWTNNPYTIDARWDTVLNRIRKYHNSTRPAMRRVSPRMMFGFSDAPQLLHKGRKP